MIAMAGMNPHKWLRSEDPFERNVMSAIAYRRAKIASDERQDLAERIISVLGRAMK